MDAEKQEVTQTVERSDGTAQARRVVTAHETQPGGLTMLRNVVYILFAALIVLLVIRLFLSLGGANRTNDFANFIYSLSAPFVAPFRGLFSIDTTIGGTARFEYEVVVAMIVYGLLGWLVLLVLRVPDHKEV